ncbi:tRNA N(3)-methylcytidine methyltransferase METTL2 isoform X2 [Apis cerana]|uniref:tRNA N(3)-methylcytidine methyltransferase METTL2 isoform X2 n=1 Tax=Apis cerana TaxID=7461 RepID=UPI002B23B7EF|nr:tRNA N(3)-methylcytidine methyltransferase METTL2 isoform X2 [Apis cerana]
MEEDISKFQQNESNNKRPQFGNRILSNNNNVFQHNAWDNIIWDEEQQNLAKQKVNENSTITMSDEKIWEYEHEAYKYWDKFYGIHENKFFKDRHWLFTEFPELAADIVKQNIKQPLRFKNENIKKNNQETHENILDLPNKNGNKILEIGCGVGNTVFPILLYNTDANLFVYCCDFSAKALDILKQNSAYDTSRMKHIIEQVHKYLKSGGLVLFRDYGRYDLAQLRFKKGSCLANNFYVRGDGTRVYFFTQEEIRILFTSCGFIEEQNLIDKRLQINRGKQLKMYRVWIQGKYRK